LIVDFIFEGLIRCSGTFAFIRIIGVFAWCGLAFIRVRNASLRRSRSRVAGIINGPGAFMFVTIFRLTFMLVILWFTIFIGCQSLYPIIKSSSC
jgi:hypothetical protein